MKYLRYLYGKKIVTSPHLYKEKDVVIGIPDSRRPNGKKALYRKTTVKIPLAYMSGDTIFCHPSILDDIEKQARKTTVLFATKSLELSYKSMASLSLTVDELAKNCYELYRTWGYFKVSQMPVFNSSCS